MGVSSFKAGLAACLLLVFVLLAACSEDPDGPDRAHREDSPDGLVPQTSTPRATPDASGGYLEHTVGGTVLRDDERVVSIEEAQLQRVEDGDEIAVLATIRGSHEYGRDCFLLEENAWSTMRRSLESGVWREGALRNVEEWEDDAPRSPEVVSAGSGYTKFFYVGPDGEAPNPREAPYFALCYKEDAAPEGGGTMVWYDVAHVEGTPGSSQSEAFIHRTSEKKNSTTSPVEGS